MNALDDLPCRRFDLRPQRDGSDIVLTDVSGEQVCRLNETAFALWQLCDGTTSVAEMSTAISEAAGIDYPEARVEVASALADLQRSGALV